MFGDGERLAERRALAQVGDLGRLKMERARSQPRALKLSGSPRRVRQNVLSEHRELSGTHQGHSANRRGMPDDYAYEPIPRPHVIGRRKGHLPPMIVLRDTT